MTTSTLKEEINSQNSIETYENSLKRFLVVKELEIRPSRVYDSILCRDENIFKSSLSY